MESNNASVKENLFDSTLLIAAGFDPFQLVNQAVAAAARISGQHTDIFVRAWKIYTDKFAFFFLRKAGEAKLLVECP